MKKDTNALPSMTNAINILQASKYYSELLDSFDTEKKLRYDIDGKELSEAIYFHICKMKYAGWRHRIRFKRGRKHPISELFQDIVAFYLKVSLPNKYEIELEKKKEKTQPDIAVKLNGEYVFLIEIKTNMGWARPDKNAPDPAKEFSDRFKQRVSELSSNFVVREENIIYIFEEHSNVGKKFSQKFLDKGQSQPRPTEFPFSIIYPLFNATDPYYWKHPRGFKRKEDCRPISDAEILLKAKDNIVTPFEDVLTIITGASLRKGR